ncbi:SUMO-specific protease U1p1 [Planoprotostelium fungivorum]|uniref:SUMO-specific protease U1p1 n=1 Tax=Planoprotostelium fungivorum TaxID=1890364 RepID=A0A2P6NU29_9EUKA|nr:SUMO-specific protease U1p1 [Planoprotostelium fungivorum]
MSTPIKRRSGVNICEEDSTQSSRKRQRTEENPSILGKIGSFLGGLLGFNQINSTMQDEKKTNAQRQRKRMTFAPNQPVREEEETSEEPADNGQSNGHHHPQEHLQPQGYPMSQQPTQNINNGMMYSYVPGYPVPFLMVPFPPQQPVPFMQHSYANTTLDQSLHNSFDQSLHHSSVDTTHHEDHSDADASNVSLEGLHISRKNFHNRSHHHDRRRQNASPSSTTPIRSSPSRSSPSKEEPQEEKEIKETLRPYQKWLQQRSVAQNAKNSRKAVTPVRKPNRSVVDLCDSNDSADEGINARSISRNNLIDLSNEEEKAETKLYTPVRKNTWLEGFRRRQFKVRQEAADYCKQTEEHKNNMRKFRDERLKDSSEYRALRNRHQDYKDGIIAFTEDEVDVIHTALRGGQNEVISEAFNIKVTRGDICTLDGSNWLNDEVINFYLNMLMDRNKKSQGKLPNCELMNTFFYPMLAEKGYDRVKKWTRKFDIFERDKIVIPIHLGVHWCLAVVNIREKRFEYYDSMDNPSGSLFRHLRGWVEKEHMDKKKKPISLDDWENYHPPDIPKQQNGYDCGVFTNTWDTFEGG